MFSFCAPCELSVGNVLNHLYWFIKSLRNTLFHWPPIKSIWVLFKNLWHKCSFATTVTLRCSLKLASCLQVCFLSLSSNQKPQRPHSCSYSWCFSTSVPPSVWTKYIITYCTWVIWSNALNIQCYNSVIMKCMNVSILFLNNVNYSDTSKRKFDWPSLLCSVGTRSTRKRSSKPWRLSISSTRLEPPKPATQCSTTWLAGRSRQFAL